MSPILIGIISIIPGLGFFALGQSRRGLGSIGFVFGFFVIASFSTNRSFAQLFFTFMWFAYFGQIYLAARTADLLNKQASGKARVPRKGKPLPPPPIQSTHHERIMHKVRETIRRELDSGENLIEVVLAQVLPSMTAHMLIGPIVAFSARAYYIGLTNKALILIELDFANKPADVQRIILRDIESSILNKGLFTDTLELSLSKKKHMKLQVNFRQRHEAQIIADTLKQYNKT